MAAVTLLALALVLLATDGPTFAETRAVQGGAPVPISGAAALAPVTLDGSAPQPLGGGWEQVTLPTGPGRVVRSLAPSLFDAAEAFACVGATSDQPNATALRGPLVVWRTHDAGAHWTELPLPGLVGTWCQLNVAPDGSPGIALVAYDGSSAMTFLSRGDGMSWMRITTPDVIPSGITEAQYQLWPTADHLYYWYTYDAYDTWVVATVEHGSSGYRIPHYVSGLWRSDDDGRTWVRADGGLNGAVGFIYPTHDQNRLVTRLYTGTGRDTQDELWETRDAGQTWHVAATIGMPAGLLVIPTGGKDDVMARAPDYATLDEQIPASIFRLGGLARGSGAWSILPPLPVPGASPGRTGLLQIYEETGDGRLLAFGVDPRAGVPSEAATRSGWTGLSQQWLWIWDQRVGRWLVWPTPLPVPYRWGCGVCLEHHATWAVGPGAHGATDSGTYLWLSDILTDGFGNGKVAYRLFVPDAPPGELILPT